MINVVLVDDQALIRAGFRLLLDPHDDIAVIGEASTGTEAVTAALELRPDVVLMDVQMPDMDGIEATRAIVEAIGPADAEASGTTRILILTTFQRDDYLFEALRAGASGFLLKTAPPEDLINAVRVVAQGNSLLDPAVTGRVIGQFTAGGSAVSRSDALEILTDREREVLENLALGKTNAEIAESLYVGEATVKTHVSNVLSKLGLRDRVQAVVFAYESGLIRPGAGTE